MGSGVWPLAMATRPASLPRNARDSGRPSGDLSCEPAPSRCLWGRPPLSRGQALGRRFHGDLSLSWGASCPADAGREGLAAARGRRPAEPGSRRSGAAPVATVQRVAPEFRRGASKLAPGSSAGRAISTGQLRGLPRFHLRPIDVVVFHGSRRDLVLRRVSRLDAFSGYPVRT